MCFLLHATLPQVVPESQVSLGESEKNTAPYLVPTPSAPVQVKDFCVVYYIKYIEVK